MQILKDEHKAVLSREHSERLSHLSEHTLLTCALYLTLESLTVSFFDKRG